MGLYENTNGVLSPIAGRGKAEYGASAVRTGTIVFPSTGSSYSSDATVTFDEPMPDGDYVVVFHPSAGDYEKRVMPNIMSQTANGFTARAYNINAQTNINSTTYAYTAFKLYTDNEYNGLLNNQRYSTDEIDTGKTWIDGKKIYRKVVEFGALPNATSKDVAHGISNLDYIVSINTTARYNTNYISIPYVDETTLANAISISIRNTKIRISSGANQSMYTATVVIEYTKTT